MKSSRARSYQVRHTLSNASRHTYGNEEQRQQQQRRYYLRYIVKLGCILCVCFVPPFVFMGVLNPEARTMLLTRNDWRKRHLTFAFKIPSRPLLFLDR